jgi:hypothetical protein
MATEDDAAAAKPIPAAEEPSKAEKEAQEKLAEKLTERIRAGNTQPPPPPDDKLTETIRQRLEHLVPELVKKTFSAGMGAVFSTEEGIRRIAREVSLPDVAGYIASSADGAKDRVWEIIARETREFLSTLNLTDEIAKILTTLSFEIKTEIRFIPNSERVMGAEPDVKASVKLKRTTPDDKDKDKDKDNPDDRDSRSRIGRFWRRGEGGGPEGDEDDSPDK